MSKSRLFRPAMVALAITVVAAIALITPSAPALAGDCYSYILPSVCADVNTYCATECSLPTFCCSGGSYLACVSAYNSSLQCAPPTTTGTCTDDGRVNDNCSAPEIVYCDEDEVDFYYYNYFTGEGEYDFSIPTDLLLQSVEARTLVWQDGAVQVYLNPDGSVLLLAPQTDGKTYYLQFDPYVCVPIHEGAEWGLQ